MENLAEGMAEFRDRARTWLEENVPTSKRPDDSHEACEFDKAWQAAQYEGGWAGLTWPKEFGGRDLSPLEYVVWLEEAAHAGAPSLGTFTIAIGHAGPTLIEVGTEAQQERYLDPILRGETPWCQGFSEPDAGSDLAALRTSGVIDGDDLVINGRKIWTSWGDVASYQELLIRTDPDAPKHKGISWVVLDMNTPGLSVAPIRTIDGHAHFSECVYENVRVPLENVVGGLNNGWSVAMKTLATERGLGYFGTRVLIEHYADRLVEEIRDRKLEDTELGSEARRLKAESHAVRSLAYQSAANFEPRELNDGVSQLFYAQAYRRMTRLALTLFEDDVLQGGTWWSEYLAALPLSIAGGTVDIQKNIIAERVLGLPR